MDPSPVRFTLEPLNETCFVLASDAPRDMHALTAYWLQHPPPWLLNLTPIEQQCMIEVSPDMDRWQLQRIIQQAYNDVANTPQVLLQQHTLTINTDGALDIDTVMIHSGMAASEIYHMLAAQPLTVEAVGFAPGFAYLGRIPEKLQLPRMATPRTHVPAGSFAIASHYAAVYPQASPGGWHILGLCDAVLFAPESDKPNTLAVGDSVQLAFTGGLV